METAERLEEGMTSLKHFSVSDSRLSTLSLFILNAYE